MKKVISLMVVLLGVLVVTSGCTKEEQKTMVCTLTKKDVVNKYDLKSTYKVNYTGEVVDNVETEEIITSDEAVVLETFETQLNDIYNAMKDNYGGYDINITNDGTKVTSLVKIDYSKLDFKKLIEDNSTMKNYVNKDNRLTLDGIKTMYKAQGITCK